jgi:hypothetical protein
MPISGVLSPALAALLSQACCMFAFAPAKTWNKHAR